MTDVTTPAMRRTSTGQTPQDVGTVVAVNADGSPIGGVSGIGTPSDAAWSGTGDGTVIAILKANYALLVQIRDNTTVS